MSVDPIGQLADAITGNTQDATPVASLKIATITAIESTGALRVQTDQTGTAWLSRDADTVLTVGDRVWIIQQGGVWLVGGRLGGTGSSSPIGSLTMFSGSTAPAGWLICDGSAVSRTTYNDLFAVTGTTYGSGDGSTTFNLPNMQNRFPIGSGTNARGATGGSNTLTLSTANLPAHDHSSAGDHTHASAGGHSHDSIGDHQHSVSPLGAGVQGASGTVRNYFYDAAGTSVTTTSAGGHTHASDGSHAHADAGTHTHTSVGSGSAATVTPAFLSLPYIIRAQ